MHRTLSLSCSEETQTSGTLRLVTGLSDQLAQDGQSVSLTLDVSPCQVAKVGLPSGVYDVWEKLGKQEHCRYTWDTKANNNKTVNYVSRCRFDRIYIRSATREGVPRLVPDHMALVGLEKLDCGRYTSDHWGIYCSFTVGQKQQLQLRLYLLSVRA